MRAALKAGFKANEFVRSEMIDSRKRRELARIQADEALSKAGIGKPTDAVQRARTSLLHEEEPQERTLW